MARDRNQNRNAVFGALIVIGIIAITLLVFFIGDILRRFERSVEVVALVDYVGALERNSPVWLAGQEVGVVTKVEFRSAAVDSTERVAVTMEVPRKLVAQVRRDSEVRITSERLIGNPVVDILPGSPDSPAIRSGDTLRIRPAGTIEGLLNRAILLTAGFDTMFRSMAALQAPALRRGEQVQRINRSLAAVGSQFRELMLALENGPAQALGDARFQAVLTRVSESTRQLSAAFGTAAERAGRAQSDARPSLEKLKARTDSLKTQMDALQSRIAESGGGLLIRAQRDSAIMKAIHESQVQLDSLMAETKRNPLRFWF